jgi:thermolabile hemolysin
MGLGEGQNGLNGLNKLDPPPGRFLYRQGIIGTNLLLLFFPMHPITNLYNFGDSFSDTGNARHLTNGQLAHESGRFSDGLIWIDFLAAHLGLTLAPSDAASGAIANLNFATGGATTGSENLFPAVMPHLPQLPGLQQQIQGFLTLAQGKADPEALYIIWAGAADYAPFVQGIPQHSSCEIPIANLSTALSQLTQAGAKSILLVNLIDLGKTPLAAQVAAITPAPQVSRAIDAHNHALLNLATSLNIMHLDAHSIVNQMLTQPQELTFWDLVHPTQYVHNSLAQAAIKLIDNAKVPAFA